MHNNKTAPHKVPEEEDDWVHPIGNDGSVACGAFLLLAARQVSGDVHPTCDLAMCALHMLWASVDDASPWEVAKQSFCRLATPGALRLMNVNGNAIVSSVHAAPFRDLSSICHTARERTSSCEWTRRPLRESPRSATASYSAVRASSR